MHEFSSFGQQMEVFHRELAKSQRFGFGSSLGSMVIFVYLFNNGEKRCDNPPGKWKWETESEEMKKDSQS